MQYIYGYNELNTVPDNPTSARVQARRILSGPTLETAKSSTTGAVLFGEHVAVALVMQAAGSGAKAHSHPNEQFNYILQGVMVSDIDEEKQTFGSKGMIVHTPLPVSVPLFKTAPLGTPLTLNGPSPKDGDISISNGIAVSSLPRTSLAVSVGAKGTSSSGLNAYIDQ